MDEAARAAELERRIDAFHLTLPFRNLSSRSLLRWYLYLLGEDAIRAPHIFAIERTSSHQFLVADDAKFSLQWAFLWTDDVGDESDFTPPRSIDFETTYSQAVNHFRAAHSYSGVIAPFTLWHKGVAQVRTASDRAVVFDADPREARFDALARMLDLANPVRLPSSDPSSACYRRAFQTLEPVRGEQFRYRYTREAVRDLAGQWVGTLGKQTRLPSGWRIGPFSWDELSLYWATLKAVCQIHAVVGIAAHGRFGLRGGGLASALLYKTERDWCRLITDVTGIHTETTKALIDFSTYDPDQGARDVVLQPFVPAGSGLILPPHLLLSSDLERNFRVVAARRMKSEYDVSSGMFEADMVARCLRYGAAKDWVACSQRRLPGRPDLPDIDVGFYDRQSNVLLLCQLKETVDPADPIEVFDRSRRVEASALKQAKAIQTNATEHPEAVWRACFPEENFRSPRVFHAVLIRGFAGSAQSLDAGIPSLELEHFFEIARRRTLAETAEHIQGFEYLPREGQDFDRLEQTLEFADISVTWWGIVLERDRERFRQQSSRK